MKPQTLIMLVIALGCGLAALVMTQKMLPSGGAEAATGDQVKVVVVSADIARGEQMTDLKIKEVMYPKNLLPETYITDKSQVLGRVTPFGFQKNEVVTAAKLADEGTRPGLEPLLKEGRRAMSLKLNPDAAAAGFVRPGNKVDVIISVPSRGKTPAWSKTVLQNVEVLAVGKDMKMDDPGQKGVQLDMVTLLVTVEEAQKLALAQAGGKLSLVMRSSVDDAKVRTRVTTGQDLATDQGQSAEELMGEEGDPDTIILDPDQIAKAPNILDSIIAGVKPNTAPEEEAGETEVAMEEPEEDPIPTKNWKKLKYRHLDGSELMPVYVDADSKIAVTLAEFLEPVSPEEEALLQDQWAMEYRKLREKEQKLLEMQQRESAPQESTPTETR